MAYPGACNKKWQHVSMHFLWLHYVNKYRSQLAPISQTFLFVESQGNERLKYDCEKIGQLSR